ncbi:hypothetical protein GCM10027570_40870 [Streptomonospora sediminis]
MERVRTALEQGARARGFESDLWTLERVSRVVAAVTGVVLSRASVRLGWSLQRPGGRVRVRYVGLRGGRAPAMSDSRFMIMQECPSQP